MTTDAAKDEWLIDDGDHGGTHVPVEVPWKVLVVDDEPDIHTVTRLALNSVRYRGRGIQLMSAYSADQAFELLRQDPDIALVLLDVVMETDDAGLRLVRRIREELHNVCVRIVLRTGQPGHAPEQDVILNYDINDYKAKTELTVQKLFTTVIASLRAYENLVTIERSREGLHKILEGTANLYRQQSVRELASGVLHQISAILGLGAHGILCAQSLTKPAGELQILGATGVFAYLECSGSLNPQHPAYEKIMRALHTRHSIGEQVLYFPTHADQDCVIYFEPSRPLQHVERQLLEVFCGRISAAFDNLHFNEQIALAQAAEQRARELQADNLRLQEVDRQKSHFLATMSHELRTPLNAVLGYTGTMLMRLPGPLTGDQENQLNIIRTSAQHLLSLINDLLDLARIEAGKLDLRMETVDCNEVASDVAATLKPLAEKRKLSIKLDLPAAPISINTDHRALKQIILNLANNAIKFTDQGGLTLIVRPLENNPRKEIEFRVVDTGVGIKPEDRERLFRLFSQLESVPREGSGLGLHLSRRLANLLGGRIEFDSEFGKGSRFSLLLPMS
jgi:signal transduction histidine kinase